MQEALLYIVGVGAITGAAFFFWTNFQIIREEKEAQRRNDFDWR